MEDLPTLLLLGKGEPMRAALEEALARHAAFTEASDAESPVAAVMVSAPDLVVLMGDACAKHAIILKQLSENPMTRTVPIALLAPASLGIRLSAARRGVAMVDRTASVDEMAKQIARLARTLPEQPGRTEGPVGSATLQELLEIIKEQLEGGILSVSQEGGKSARFVLQPGRNVDAAIRDFVRRIKPLLKEDKPLHYEFDGEGSTLAVLSDVVASGDIAQLKGRRILLVEDDASIADTLCQELRAAGSIVSVCTTAGRGLQRARALDPEIVLVDEDSLDGASYEVLRTIRRDSALRWASLLVLRLEDITPERGAPRLDHLAANIVSLLAPDREIAKRADEEDRFETRLATLGPTRLLRAVSKSGGAHHVSVRNPRVTIEVALAEGLIAGARATLASGGKPLAGTTALAALLAVSSGRVTIEKRPAPAMANLLTPIADAFVQAAHESPPIRPSMAPGPSKLPGQRDTPAPHVLLSELKDLLQKMRDSDGIPADVAAEIRTAEVMLPEIRTKTPAAADVADGAAEDPPPRSSYKPPAPSTPPPAPSGTTEPAAKPAAAKPAAAKPASKKPAAPPRPVVPPPPMVKLPPAKKGGKKPAAKERKRKPLQRRSTMQGMPAPKLEIGAPPKVAAAKSESPTAPEDAPAIVDSDTRVDVALSTLDALDGPTFPTPLSEPPSVDELLAAASVAPPSSVQELSVDDLLVPSGDIPVSFDDPDEGLGETLPEMSGDLPETAPVISVPAVDFAPPPEVGPLGSVGSVAPLGPVATETMEEISDPIVVRSSSRGWIIGVLLVLLLAGGGAAYWFTQNQGPPPSTSNPPTVTELETATLTAETETETAETETEQTEAETETAEAAEGETTEGGTTEGLEGEAAEEGSEGEVAEGEVLEGDSTEGEAEQGEENPALAEGAGGEELSEEEAAELETAPARESRVDRINRFVRAGNFYRGRRRWDRARNRYRAALRLAPRNARALAGLTKVALAQGRAGEAVTFARRLVRANPGNPMSHVLLGDAMKATGNTAAARRAYRAALRRRPRHRIARARLEAL